MSIQSSHAPLHVIGVQVAGRLCMAVVEDPAGPQAERACLLLAAVANTLAHAPAYMRLYEPAAEAMPLRLEQVRQGQCTPVDYSKHRDGFRSVDGES
jgi:hypothetical protein